MRGRVSKFGLERTVALKKIRLVVTQTTLM